MYRRRLREKYTDEELAKIYAKPHDATQWSSHIQRCETTVAAARWLTPVESIADLSCGNGYIPTTIRDRYAKNAKVYLGDYASSYPFTGPIEETIGQIPDVDLFVFSETIEHLDDPDNVLLQIRQKSKSLVMSTPIGENNTDNDEHYWGWDTEAVRDMLQKTGWYPEALTTLSFHDPAHVYSYQIWTCT